MDLIKELFRRRMHRLKFIYFHREFDSNENENSRKVDKDNRAPFMRFSRFPKTEGGIGNEIAK